MSNHNSSTNNNRYVDKRSNIVIKYNESRLLETVESDYQKIEVYDSRFFGKMLIIDDDIQTTERDEPNYHEMIAHVPLNISHDAKTVLVIGGGDGGTAREVLKHTNVESVTMIEIDKEVVRLSKKYFEKAKQTFDEPRLKLFHDDAAEWVKSGEPNSFDVVLIDSTDFNHGSKLQTDEFFSNVKRLLKKPGIMVFNALSLSWYRRAALKMRKQLEKHFKYVFLYRTNVPTYASGDYSFCFCSNEINPKNTPIDRLKFEQKKIFCKYYNPDIHKASFYLQEFANMMVTKESSKNKELLGTHYMVDCKNVSFQRLNDSEAIKHMFDEIIASYDLKVVESGKVVHQFSPQGVTCVYTLSTSHLSIHTWPEKGKATLDLYTCNTISYYPERTLEKIVARYFNCPTEELKFRIIYREI